MTEQIHLEKAPIKEAIIDFRTTPNENLDLENCIDSLKEELSANYPEEVNQTMETTINIGEVQLNRKKAIAILLKSEDTKDVVRISGSGFGYSRFHPYNSWEETIKKARETWQTYVKIIKPREIARLAVRYINFLDLPITASLEKYITDPPTLPGQIDATLKGFFSQSVITDAKTGLEAIYTQRLEQSLKPEHKTFIIDIDVFSSRTFDPGDDSIWNVFENLREFKNRLFFDSITDYASEKYK